MTLDEEMIAAISHSKRLMTPSELDELRALVIAARTRRRFAQQDAERELPRQLHRSANRLRRRWLKRWSPFVVKQFMGMLPDSVSDARACAGQSSATYGRNEARRFAWMRGEPAYRAHESVNDLATLLEWERKAKERSR